jgi:hypothetical protein
MIGCGRPAELEGAAAAGEPDRGAMADLSDEQRGRSGSWHAAPTAVPTPAVPCWEHSASRRLPYAMAKLKDDQLRVLRALERHPEGCAEAVLLAEGCSVGQLAALVIDGFATTLPTLTHDGGREKIVVRMTITEAGRKAIAE